MSITKDMAFLDSAQPAQTKMNSISNHHFAAGNRNAMSDHSTIKKHRA